ncbi:MAG: transposase [Elusimicrobia bacterium]|nr:transposase [Elusimicrobiota bacterium]
MQGKNKLLRMVPLEFMRRVAVLIPPPNKNLVHYYGALAPNSSLRELTVKEARKAAERERRKTKTPNQAARSWAALLSRIFELEPHICSQCGATLVPVAAIMDDRELVPFPSIIGRDSPGQVASSALGGGLLRRGFAGRPPSRLIRGH